VSVDIEIANNVAIITLNRPDRHNALDAEHYNALSRAWVRVRDDQNIRCAVITGAGDKAFTTGADLKSWIGRRFEPSELWLTQKDQLLNRGLEVWKPVIAAINGYCLGGGMTLMLASDIRIAADHAEVGLPEVQRGIVPANGGTQRLLAQVPHAIGMEWLLTGGRFGTQTALRWGLVNQVVPRAKVLEAALDYARRIAVNAPFTVQATKELAIRSRDVDLATGLRMEQLVNRTLQTTADVQEGREAFASKRAPNFKGE
jgi:E-phenylitaconyl-CoA hydratase